MSVLTLFNQHPWLLPVSLLLLGLVVGSFINLVILRLPVMLEREERSYCGELLGVETGKFERFDLVRPGSRCPSCGHRIRAWENIPLISYLLLRGHCSHCGAHISLRYPLVELCSGLLILYLGLHYGSASPQLLGAMLLTWSLLALGMIDLDTGILPDAITLPLLWLGLMFNLFGAFASLPDAVLGAMAGYLSLWAVYWIFKWLTGRRGMGHGDFKLTAALGAWLGWQALPLIILLSSLAGLAGAMLMLLLRRRSRSAPIPFGPWLAGAGWIALLWGAPMMTWYWRSIGLPNP